MTVDWGWDPDHFIGGHQFPGAPWLFGVFRSNPGGYWRLVINPVNLRMQFVFDRPVPAGRDVWEYLAEQIGPD